MQQVCCVVTLELRKWHNDITGFCPCQLVTNLIQGRYGETGVMNFLKTCYGEVANLLQTYYGENGVMDFGL